MEMTMTGVIISVVGSGIVSLFISQTFLRKRMGLGLGLIFFLPILSCGLYVYLTSPHFSTPSSDNLVSQLMNQKKEPEPQITPEEINTLANKVEESPDDLESVVYLANAYMNREEYDIAISLLKSKEKLFPAEDIKVQLTTAYFAKGLLFAEQGNFKAALTDLKTAQKIAPEGTTFLPDLKHFIMIIEKQISDKDQSETNSDKNHEQ